MNMIPNNIKEVLKSNWGEKADTLNCFAEIKLIDPLSSLAFYIFAMDAEEKMVNTVIYRDTLGVAIFTLYYNEILQSYNREGENPVIDHEYRRTRVTELLKRLGNDTRRNY